MQTNTQSEELQTDGRQFFDLPPLGLYVHIPWCIKKCPYCDFNSHEQKKAIPENAYVDALLDDLSDEMPLVWGRSISSVFIGGGTPSLFSATAIDRLISGIRALTALSPQIEVTMEANPGTFEQERFKDYRAVGINRLSIGVQSFDPRFLEALGRAHSSSEAFKAIEIAHTAGFEQINLDLMFALPGQTLSNCMADVDHAISRATTHLSFYELTIEPNTWFARFPPVQPDDDKRARMQDSIEQELAQAGFDRYEVSAYARSKNTVANRSQHNMNYWQFGDYIGIGAGAHGKISSADSGNIVRRWKHKHPETYLTAQSAAQRLGGQHVVPVHETALEFMMNALRLREGFPIPLFQQSTGVSLELWQSQINEAMRRGLLEQHGLNLRASAHGYNWLNELLEIFLPTEPATAAEPEPATRHYPTIPLIVDR